MSGIITEFLFPQGHNGLLLMDLVVDEVPPSIAHQAAGGQIDRRERLEHLRKLIFNFTFVIKEATLAYVGNDKIESAIE